MKKFQKPKLVQLLKALALLLDRSPLTGAEIMAGIGEVPEGTKVLDPSKKRAFERLKADLIELGVRLEQTRGSDSHLSTREGGPSKFETVYYSLPKKRYLLRHLDLTDEETQVLRVLGQILGQEERFPLRSNLALAFQKLSLHSSSAHVGGDRMEAVDGPLPPSHDSLVLDKLMLASSRRRSVRFTYRSFHSGTTRERWVEPYGFFTREGVWYLVGRDCEAEEIRVFRVGRVDPKKGVSETDSPSFVVPPDFNLRDYSAVPPWNFFSEEKPRKVTVAIDQQDFWRVRKFCEEQGEVEENDSGQVRWTLDVRNFDPLVKWLLPLGPSAIPIEPADFVRRYREIVVDTLRNYGEVA